MKTKATKLINYFWNETFTADLRSRLAFLLAVIGILVAIGVLLGGGLFRGSASSAQTRDNVKPVGSPLAQSDNLWHDLDEQRLSATAARQIVPSVYRTVSLDREALRALLASAPLEFTSAARHGQVVMTLPMPDGKLARFAIVESPMMEPGLAAKMPEFKSYRGQGIDDPTATMRCDWSPAGFHATIIGASGSVYFDPYALNDTENYISYRKSDYRRSDETFSCGVDGEGVSVAGGLRNLTAPEVTNGTTLRSYRLAMAAAGEYTAFHRQAGDTDDQAKTRAQTAMNVGVNRMNTVFERDLSVRLVVIANNLNIVYTNAATDPYNGNDNAMADQNQANLTTPGTIGGAAAYDIGHVVTTVGAGTAAAPSACNDQQKAEGKSGGDNPVNDPFFIDMVTHEIGHQFGALHSYNGVDPGPMDGCTTRTANDAFEPSSGSTIMSYAGVCAVSNLQRNADAMFSVRSLEVMVAYTNGGGACGTATATGNTVPAVTAPASFNIPKGTPFTLTAVGNDANGDVLTYSWEQYN
ncbi:MAG: reprolysin-like metallopeptidase, partial [Pyrinomonadaceae bacterium]